MAARVKMEDRAQQPQECLGKHLHGCLLSGIQNDFIYLFIAEDLVCLGLVCHIMPMLDLLDQLSDKGW